MAPTTYIEDLSPTQIYDLAQAARGKLSLLRTQADHNLRRMVGGAMLLDILELELMHAKRERVQKGSARHRRAPLRRERPRDSPSVMITVVEVTEDNTTPVSENKNDRSRTIQVLESTPASRCSQDPLDELVLEEWVEICEDSYKDDALNDLNALASSGQLRVHHNNLLDLGCGFEGSDSEDWDQDLISSFSGLAKNLSKQEDET